jgi:hypothetical protein
MALIRLSEELSASFIRVTRIGELGTTLAVTNNRRVMKGALSSSDRRFLQQPHGVTSQKTPFFIVTAVKTLNLTRLPFFAWVFLKINCTELIKTKTKQTPWPLVRKRTIRTERPPLIGEV